MHTPNSNTAPLTPHRAVVDIRLDADGGLCVAWHDASNMAARTVPPAHVRRLLATMDAVNDAEQTKDAARLRGVWLAASNELVALLDGPERALHDRVETAEGQGQCLVVIVRALAAYQDALRHHPATRMLWQLLPHADAEAHGRRRFSAVLQLGPREPGEPWALPHAGLRILFMAFSPRHVVPVLDHEHEEERLLSVLAPFLASGRASVRIVEDGTLEDLGRALLLEDYDVLHLTGHGIRTPKGPRLAMEDETGQERLVSPDELIGILRRAAAMPPLVVLSNCHSADARGTTPSFAVELVAAGVPMAIGWTTPVRDDLATMATSALYEQLASGKWPQEAVELARDALRQAGAGPQPAHTWATLALVSSAAAGFRVDRRAPPLPPSPQAQETYAFLAEGHMKVMLRGFVGRRRPLQRLVRVLRDGKFADDDDAEPRAVVGAVVWGMKGVGKSCLVARAIERARQHDAELRMVVLHGTVDEQELLTALQRALDPSVDTDAEQMLAQKDIPVLQRARRVLHLWRRRPVVVVLDDFEQNLDLRMDGPARMNSHAAELLDILVPACTRGKLKVLVTTTATFEVPAPHAAAFCELPLGALEAASVHKLWMRGPSASVSLGQWEALAVRLGNNARILSWARDLLAGKTSDELAKIAARAAEQLPVWQPGDEIRQEKHDELARLFLRHLAHEDARARVGSDAHVFLRRARVYDVAVPAQAFEALTEGLSIDLERDLVVLANLGLLEVGELDGQRAYRVSPLVEPRFVADLPEKWHTAASRFWLSMGQTTRLFGPILRSWRHALAGRDLRLAEQAGRILHPTLRDAGRYRESLGYADEHLRMFPESVFGLHWAGGAEVDALGPTPRARTRLEAALAKWNNSRDGETALDLAGTIHALGGLRREQGDLVGARDAFKHALDIQVEYHGGEISSDVAASYHGLGCVLQLLHQLPEARMALEKALAIHRQLGRAERDTEYAATLHALGCVAWAEGDLEGARRTIMHSIEIKGTLRGFGDHPGDAAALHVLGGILHDEGRLTEARSTLERALQIHVKVHGSEHHPDGARTLAALGGVLLDLGELDVALLSLERALQICKLVHRTELHPDVARIMHKMGELMLIRADLVESRKYLQNALRIWTVVRGSDLHLDAAAVCQDLGCALLAQGEVGLARESFERCISIRKELRGDRHISLVTPLNYIAHARLASQEPKDAVAYLRQALEIQGSCFGTCDRSEYAETEAVLAWVLLHLGQTEEGQARSAHCAPLLLAAYPEHPYLIQLGAPFPSAREFAPQ